MPNDKEIEVILRLRDEVTKTLQGVQANFHRFSNQIKEMGLDMRKTGREMSFLGSSMAMAGAAITTPLIAAYKEAGKYNADIAHQLNETKNVFQNLSVSIGTALLPVMKNLTDQTARLVAWWESLGAVTQEKIITNIFNLGRNLAILGISMIIVGKSLSALGNLALLASNLRYLDPKIALITAGFIALGAAAWKFKGIADAVTNTLEVLGATVGQTVDYILMLWNALHFRFGEIKKDLEDINRYGGIIQNILSGKNGDAAEKFQEFKQNFSDIASIYDEVTKAISDTSLDFERVKQAQGTFFSGFRMGLEQTRASLASWRDMGLQAALDLFSGIQATSKTLFVDAFHGQLKKASDYFAAFGDKLIDIFANVCSQIIDRWIETMIITGLGDLFGLGGRTANIAGMGTVPIAPANYYLSPAAILHEGGIIRAHSGLNLASDEVPIIAQTGERVLSRSQNREYENGSRSKIVYNYTIHNHINAVDAQSFNELCMRSPEAIKNISKITVLEDYRLNGPTRRQNR